MTMIQTHVQYLVNAARVAIEMGGLTPEQALDLVARNATQNATQARTRGGRWAQETATTTIDEALFAGSVARDILDETIERPSTGNVRQYALQMLAPQTPTEAPAPVTSDALTQQRMRGSHAACEHPATPAARRTCRNSTR